MKRIWSIFTAAFLQVFNRYEGATFNPQRSAIPAGYHGVRFDATAHARSELARKMRYFERNNPLVQALAGKFENFVVGASPQLSPNSSDPEWNRKAKEWWDQWCQVCDLSSRQAFGTILSLVARRWFIEGDIFIVLTKGREMLGNRPRIQLIEGHLCRTPKEYERDPMVHDGVRMDDYGRPVEYYFAEEEKQGQYTFGPPVSADFVIPVMEPERPGEVRGITHFHSCLNELHDLDDLHILEMQAARENAKVYEWITTQSGELSADTLRRNRLTGSNQDSDGTSVSEDRTAYYEQVTGGKAKVLKAGDDVKQNPGMRPSVVTVEYWKLKRELVCAAVEIPYCIVFPDSMQGTVYRGALDMATAAFKSRHAVIADVQRRIWNYVMGYAVKVDKTLADPPSDWRNVSVLPPRAPNVDVGRNANAERDALVDGRTNYDLIYGPLGLAWQTELKKLNQQCEFIEQECPALARKLAAQNAPTAAFGNQAAPEDDAEEETVPKKKPDTTEEE